MDGIVAPPETLKWQNGGDHPARAVDSTQVRTVDRGLGVHRFVQVSRYRGRIRESGVGSSANAEAFEIFLRVNTLEGVSPIASDRLYTQSDR